MLAIDRRIQWKTRELSDRLAVKRSRRIGAAVGASIRLIHADLGALPTLSLRSGEKFSPLGNKQAGLGVGRRGVMGDSVEVIVIPVLEHFEKARTGQHVDSTSARVVKQVVRRTRSFPGRNFLSGLRVKNEHSRRGPGCHE